MKAAAAGLLLIFWGSLPAGAAEITRSVVGTGGGSVSSGALAVRGTVGQAVVGDSDAPQHAIRHGFWPGTGSLAVGIPGERPGSSVFLVYQNIPNPFHGLTEIRYRLPPMDEKAVLRIYDLRGRLVRSWDVRTGAEEAGAVLWDARDTAGRSVASGLYLYVLETRDQRLVRKMTLVR